MMRFFLISLLLILSSQLFGQFKTVPLRNSASRTASTLQAERTVNLPFWDDFSTSGSQPDTLLWQAGYDIYVNDALSKSPPTYKVATLDGLKGDGNAYDIASEFIGKTDSLVSHFIDLSGLTLSDSVFFSFYWEEGGLGELPDEEDSLMLFFYGSDLSWERVWFMQGGDVDLSGTFTQEILRLDSPKFYHDKFQFKFQSIARQSGPFDNWHLDYIYLNKARTKKDIYHFDRALTGKPKLLFDPYYEIPANVFLKNTENYISSQSIQTTNLDNTPHSVRYYYRLENLTSAEVYTDGQIPDAPVDLSPLQRDTITSPADLQLGPPAIRLDSQVVRSTFYMFSGDKKLFEEVGPGNDTLFLDVDLKVNDTIRQEYTISDHYAYDDGIAEYAAGINVKNGKLAVRYVLTEPDTLTHIDIHFPSIEPDATGKSINLIVWSEVLKNEVILTSQAYTIGSNTQVNEFKRIKLDRARLIKDTVYIGFQQLQEDYIGVGFDKTNEAAKNNIFYKTAGSWVQNDRLDGIFMIRPVFESDSTFILGLVDVSPATISVFPNPSTGLIRFSEPVDQVDIYSLNGALMYRAGIKEEHDLSELPKGIYVMRILKDDRSYNTKLILTD